MHDLTEKQLSTAIFEVVKEINRGCWLADRKGAASGGIGVDLPESVSIKARVTAYPGGVVVEQITISEQGRQVTRSEATGDQSQDSNSETIQSGSNTNTTTNTYGEAE
jgi:hypothetical protein